MRILLLAIGTATLITMAILVVTALMSAARAIRIGGPRLLFSGIAWFMLPAEARPHMRRAVTRWLGAMGCLVPPAIGLGLGDLLP